MAGREKLCLGAGAGKQQSLEPIRRDAPLFFQRWAHRAGFLRGLPAFSSPKFPAAHPSGAQPLRFNTHGCKTSAGAAVQLPPSSTRHQLRCAFPRTQPETRPPHPHGNGNQPTPWTASPPPERHSTPKPPRTATFWLSASVLGADLSAHPHSLPLHPLP